MCPQHGSPCSFFYRERPSSEAERSINSVSPRKVRILRRYWLRYFGVSSLPMIGNGYTYRILSLTLLFLILPFSAAFLTRRHRASASTLSRLSKNPTMRISRLRESTHCLTILAVQMPVLALKKSNCCWKRPVWLEAATMCLQLNSPSWCESCICTEYMTSV